MNIRPLFITNTQTPKLAEPGERSLTPSTGAVWDDGVGWWNRTARRQEGLVDALADIAV
jgi:hypothetical protein